MWPQDKYIKSGHYYWHINIVYLSYSVWELAAGFGNQWRPAVHWLLPCVCLDKSAQTSSRKNWGNKGWHISVCWCLFHFVMLNMVVCMSGLKNGLNFSLVFWVWSGPRKHVRYSQRTKWCLDGARASHCCPDCRTPVSCRHERAAPGPCGSAHSAAAHLGTWFSHPRHPGQWTRLHSVDSYKKKGMVDIKGKVYYLYAFTHSNVFKLFQRNLIQYLHAVLSKWKQLRKKLDVYIKSIPQAFKAINANQATKHSFDKSISGSFYNLGYI